MKDRKIRMKRSRGTGTPACAPETKSMSDDIRERLDVIDENMCAKLKTLDHIFAGSTDHPEDFLQLHLQPLLESGLTLEDSFSLLVEGVLRPN